MCLSVYLGCHDVINIRESAQGSLGIKIAKWSPPPLVRFPFVYYLGEKGVDNTIGCTCLLAQRVEWDNRGPNVFFDYSDPGDGPCPFATLKSYVKVALVSGKQVALACDDSGGVEQGGESDDYDHFIINEEMISSESYLFAGPLFPFPWRVFYVAATRR